LFLKIKENEKIIQLKNCKMVKQSFQDLVELYPETTSIERTSYIRLEKAKNTKTLQETVFFVYDIHAPDEEHKIIEEKILKLSDLSNKYILKHEDLFIKVKDDQLIRTYFLTTEATSFSSLKSLEKYFYETKLGNKIVPPEVFCFQFTNSS
jgi:hypothetical protein